VVGKKYLAPIPTPLALQRATYSRTTAAASLDVFAQAGAGQQLVLSDSNVAAPAITPTTMTTAGTGYLGHLVLGPAAPLPASVTVTNTTDVPPSVFTTNVTDLVSVTDAVYDPVTQILTVQATSSDTAAPPALVAAGLGPVDAAGKTFAAGPVPPESVTVSSSAGGSATRPVRLLQTTPVVVPTPLVAVNDLFSANFNTAATFAVTANDTPAGTPTLAAVVITSPPQHGTAVPGAVLGTVLYTPALNYNGPDSFAYVLRDANGALSNVASVAVTVVFVPVAPVANPDAIVTRAGVAGQTAILANDVAAIGTTLNAASVVLGALTPATAGTLVYSSATGLATFTPAAGFSGTATATYTVRNNFAQLSNTATITITVAAAADVINITLAQYRTGIGQWRVNGTSTSTAAGTTVTIYNGSTNTSPVLVANLPVVAGVFTWTSPNGSPAPSASRLILIQSTQGGSRIAAVTVRP
jgi:hypothetical protein